MARPRRSDPDLVAKAQRVVAQARDLQELRMAQAVLLPALAKMTLEHTAKALGVGRATVARLQSRFGRHSERAAAGPRSWGGRRRALLTPQEEEAFMAQWKAPAERGELVVLTPLRVALDRQVGRRVKPSVVYRLVQRHRWRKVAPDTRHPKADLQVQAQWKKKRCPKSWRPC
jgi:transposase